MALLDVLRQRLAPAGIPGLRPSLGLGLPAPSAQLPSLTDAVAALQPFLRGRVQMSSGRGGEAIPMLAPYAQRMILAGIRSAPEAQRQGLVDALAAVMAEHTRRFPQGVPNPFPAQTQALMRTPSYIASHQPSAAPAAAAPGNAAADWAVSPPPPPAPNVPPMGAVIAVPGVWGGGITVAPPGTPGAIQITTGIGQPSGGGVTIWGVPTNIKHLPPNWP